ncbi:MAG: ABC transporter ATP-binding protein [Vicinamibacteria bacterium]|nr:ABC transporter ATP-binding protein [Vicinamibacteria bacterium]
MAQAIVQLKNAVVRRRRKTILGPIDLVVNENDFLGIVGPNGAGKTTLLRALAGLTSLSGGERLSMPSLSPGFLLQGEGGSLDLPLTVLDVVLFGRVGRARRLTNADREAAKSAMERLDLAPLRLRLYRELSGGERRKVQIARLIAQETPLLLLDEPGSGLDLDWQSRLTDLVSDLRLRTGRTIVMITHEAGLLPSCCTHVLLLSRGMALATGAPPAVLTASNLSRLYGCPVEVVRRDGRFHPLIGGRG